MLLAAVAGVVVDKKSIDDFFKMDNVEDVAPLASFTSLITYESLTGSIMLNGVEPITSNMPA